MNWKGKENFGDFFAPLNPGWWLLDALDKAVKNNPEYIITIADESGNKICGYVPDNKNNMYRKILIADSEKCGLN